jgi:hypothetical protein
MIALGGDAPGAVVRLMGDEAPVGFEGERARRKAEGEAGRAAAAPA